MGQQHHLAGSRSYADIKAEASKKGLTVWSIMFGRAQLLLGHVNGAKRGTGKFARASAAKAGRPMPAMPVNRGPGRPRKNALPATNGESPRGRQPDASSKSGQVRELLNSGLSPMEIAKKVGCTPALVYNIKSSLSGGSKKLGHPGKSALPATNGVAGLDSILDAVRSTQADLGRYRTALERIGSMLSEVLA